jgi:Rrf2 family protein
MKLSTKGRYGTRAMLDIAVHKDMGPCVMKDISARQDISPKYLDHILSALRRGGLIKNIRGKGGGYILSRSAATITMKDIIEAVEGSLAPVECVDNEALCDRSQECPTIEVWRKVRDAIEGVLAGITLESLVESQQKKEPSSLQYVI